jgi:hypothetical protein
LLPAALLLQAAPLAAQPAAPGGAPRSAVPPAAPPSAAPPPAAPPSAPPSAFDQAKDRFQRGRDLFKLGAWEPALAEFLESRSLHPTWSATLHAAYCLRQLTRFDESLDMFAVLVRDFGDKLPAEPKREALRQIEETRKLVATLEVEGAVPGATLVVDQKNRGEYPLLEPLRVPAGGHTVRVFLEGYEPFEVHVDVAGGTSRRVTARLVKLTATGTLSVVEQEGRALSVVIDAVGVGRAPWKGLLAPGEHTVLLRGARDTGTPPATVIVKRDATTPLTLRAEDLRAVLRVQPTPAGATVAIDGVSVGRGAWEGRLRAGAHRVEIAADGFVLEVRHPAILAGKRETLAVTLERDPLSPLWQDNRGRFFFEADLGPGFVPDLGGDVAGACGVTCARSLGVGVLVVGRGGYRFPSGFMVSVDAGYLQAGQVVSGRATQITPVGLTPNLGEADDTLLLRGAVLGASGGVRLGQRFPLTLRLGAGVLLGAVRDHRTGQFRTVDHLPPQAYPVDVSEARPATSLYVAPEIRVSLPLGKRFEVSAGLEALVLISLARPRWDPQGAPVLAGRDGLARFAADALVGQAVLGIVPGLGARYEF